MILNKIKKIIDENPDNIAYIVNDECITYRELWNYAYDYALLLKKQGISPVIIYGHKNISVIVSILACIIANRTYVPIDESTPLLRLKKIVNMTSSSLIISDCEIKIDVIDCCSLEKLKKFENNKPKIYDNDIVYIIFTSGSTGEPKGVPISKENLNNFIEWISSLEPLCNYKNINVLNQASFSFDLSVADLYYSLCNGHTLIAFDGDIQEDCNKLFGLMKQIDVAVMTPTFMKLCLLNDDFTEDKYSNFKCVYFCGEQLECKLVKRIFDVFPNLKVINAYGPTEATSAVSCINITKDMTDKYRLLPVGNIKTFATDIKIIDNEIVLKGKSVFSGYLGDYVGGYYKEDNVNCYKTGDIGYIEDDNLYCVGRKDSQIKYKGYRIELNEIEYNINRILGVKECAVVAIYNDSNIVKTVKAFVVVENGIDVNYIRSELLKSIPYYMMPKTIKIIDKLPINQNGKINRKALCEI